MKSVTFTFQKWPGCPECEGNSTYCVSVSWFGCAQAGCDTRSIFKQSLTGLDSEFSFSWTGCLTKAKESSLPYYLAGGKIIRFIHFSWVLELCQMQSALTRIWTRVAVFISYNNNHYTMSTSVGCVHNTMWVVNSWRKMLRRSSLPWEVCTKIMERLSNHSEISAPSILMKSLILTVGSPRWVASNMMRHHLPSKRFRMHPGSARNFSQGTRMSRVWW